MRHLLYALLATSRSSPKPQRELAHGHRTLRRPGVGVGPTPVPPQNPVDGAIVGVSVLGVKLAYPDASLAVRKDRYEPGNGTGPSE